MKTFTVYDATGAILYLFNGSQEILELNLLDGQAFIEGEYLSTDYKVVGGVAIAKTDDEKLPSLDSALLELRDKRNIELSLSDWTQSPDSPLSEAQQQSWRDYRQALRDLPENTTDPLNPTWPSKPS